MAEMSEFWAATPVANIRKPKVNIFFMSKIYCFFMFQL